MTALPTFIGLEEAAGQQAAVSFVQRTFIEFASNFGLVPHMGSFVIQTECVRRQGFGTKSVRRHINWDISSS